MKYFLVVAMFFLVSGCSTTPKISYYGVAEGTPKNEAARIHNTMRAIRIIAIDGKPYSKGMLESPSDEALYLSPGKHDISIEFCTCSLEGSTYIEGVHTFSANFVADHDYGLVLNYAPPDRHELWLSHVYINEKGRQRKELLSKLGPFEIKRTDTIYVPIYH